MKSMSQTQKIILMLMALVALCLCVLFFGIILTIDPSDFPDPIPTTTPPPAVTAPATPIQPEPTMAQIKCERFIKENLKAPSTAKFLGAKTYGVDGSPANYHAVTGIVEAQNRLGVPLRSEYRCDLHYLPEDPGVWVLDYLKIEN